MCLECQGKDAAWGGGGTDGRTCVLTIAHRQGLYPSLACVNTGSSDVNENKSLSSKPHDARLVLRNGPEVKWSSLAAPKPAFWKAPCEFWVLLISYTVTAGFTDNDAVCQQPFKHLQIKFPTNTEKLGLLMRSDILHLTVLKTELLQ